MRIESHSGRCGKEEGKSAEEMRHRSRNHIAAANNNRPPEGDLRKSAAIYDRKSGRRFVRALSTTRRQNSHWRLDAFGPAPGPVCGSARTISGPPEGICAYCGMLQAGEYSFNSTAYTVICHGPNCVKG
jgi:hypothetical protein